MKFYLYANGMPFDGETIARGDSLGGSETMAYLAAKELAKRGHGVFVFANTPRGETTKTDDVNYLPIGPVDQQRAPFGFNFEKFARDVPCDVILAQRLVGIFGKPYNSKLNYFWAHDLALKRNQGPLNAMLWNMDRFLAVSEFHRKQVQEVYHLDDSLVHPLQNGIDLNLWKDPVQAEKKIASKTMLYAARPERGLIHLVREGGIMEQLFKFDPELKLLVCTYDNNHPAMAQMYHYLYSRCAQLPNVENIGPQSQQQLALIEQNSWLYVYPTEFEDTSCLMVMQNAAAGTPMVACKVGALEETGRNSGLYWSTLDKFVAAVMYLAKNPDKWTQLHKKSLEKAKEYSIERTVDVLEQYIEEDFSRLTADTQKLHDHFVYNSEIYGAWKLAEETGDHLVSGDYKKTYVTAKTGLEETEEFYQKSSDRNFELGNQHGMQNPAGLLQMGRLQPVIHQLAQLPPDAFVLDYGCCVGQLAFALKTRFPAMRFLCVDIAQDQLDVGVAYAREHVIEGIEFLKCVSPADLLEKGYSKKFDAVLALEVVEHVWDHAVFVNQLTECAKKNGVVIVSTPFGPFEHNSDDPDPLYQHLHNFEEADIIDLIGKKKDRAVTYIRDADSKKGERLGNYVWSWVEDHTVELGEIDWARKFRYQRPWKQVSACLIVQPDGKTLGRCLESISPLIDELIIGVDDPSWDPSWEMKGYDSYVASSAELVYAIGRKYGAKFLPIVSPREQGFAEARNKTIKEATKDWVLWIDDDETFVYPDRFSRFLRSEFYDSFSINHHHMTAEPVGLLKTDHPARVFKNNRGIQFFGVVHEHPETAINEGPGKTFIIPQPLGCIMHYGYETEAIRRKRFVRNFSLMKRDRDLNPERKLGKFLWIRDLAHMNRFMMERNGGRVTEEVIQQCKDALLIWRSVLHDSSLRMIQDSLQYITECVRLLTNGQGLQFKMTLELNSRGMGDNLQLPLNPIFQGVVEKKEDLAKLQEILLRDKLNMAETTQVYV